MTPTVQSDLTAITAPPNLQKRSLLAAPIATLTVLLALGAFVLPDRTVGPGDGMPSTHYMGLLATNQPWNLLLFMAVPVILAETLAVTELVVLLRGTAPGAIRQLNRWAALLAGPYLVAVTVHLLRNAVLPLTAGGGWRGPADVIAVAFYLLGTVPMAGLTLVELGVLGRTEREARTWHAAFVGTFLVVAHIAMIFGMLDPTVLGWHPTGRHLMPDGTIMGGR